MLTQRNVEERLGRLEQVAILCIGGNTDDLKPLTLQLNSSAHRILSRPELSRHRLVDDRHWQPTLVVRVREIAAGGERDSNGCKELRTDFVVLERELLVGGRNVTVDHI